MTEHRAQVDELLADYRRSRERLAAVQRELATVSASVTSDDGLVTATAGARGVLTGLVIADEAYRRYRPAELSAQVVRTAGAAAVRALAAAGEVLAPALPAGSDPQALLLGTADLGAAELVPDPVAANGTADTDDADESFEDQNWLEDAEWPRPR
ncbi:YbaB/EbfC DNA-binding family protein [Prauserella shujinwangii]|uniref:YbaB/EbfC DNA-binding family protein n=1 Tax=Prauserella shujinwangii TaxID=1453103 RepID=A0A2T0LMM4_9PSEU|nr:YbaB/EbfC family nucleoid-associated protein [Prauserella shujinwangii]PRX44324.1 YbaB/EbfC DNA-binding family protein [Prauserella shujinwangii]